MASLFQKIWPYLKPHVVSFLLIVTILILGYRLIKRERAQFESEKSSYADKIKAMRIDHEAVIGKMKASTETERKEHEEAIARWKVTLDDAQKKYEKDIEEILKKKSDTTKKILAVHGDDPIGMAEEISAVTGFKVVPPEQVK